MNLIQSLRQRWRARIEARDDREFLPAHLELIETPASPVGRLFGLAIMVFFVAGALWAWLGRVDVIATAQGHILPLGDIKTIQPVETAVVTAIAVQDGQHVRQGQTLIALDSTPSDADRDRLARDLILTRLSEARLSALAAATRGTAPPRFVAPPDAPPDLVVQARLAMQSQYDEQRAKLGSLTNQIAQKDAEADETAAQVDKVKATLSILEEKAKVHRDLEARGFGTKLAALDAEQQVAEARHDILVEARRLNQIAAARGALVQDRAAAQATYASALFDELRKEQAQDNELTQELVKARDKAGQTQLTAPISGVVAQLSVHTLHGVVTPAERLMIIVPDQTQLFVEAQLANRDVGFVHPGQPAKVKIETFNFTRYGLVDGRVMTVSSDSQFPDGRPVSDNVLSSSTPAQTPTSPSYVARIALSRTAMTVDGATRPLQPGMAATAEIKIGRRSILDYLISPIARRTQESLHER